MELGIYIVRLNGKCTTETCPLMKCTDEWEYFCAAHEPPQQVFFFHFPNVILFLIFFMF